MIVTNIIQLIFIFECCFINVLTYPAVWGRTRRGQRIPYPPSDDVPQSSRNGSPARDGISIPAQIPPTTVRPNRHVIPVIHTPVIRPGAFHVGRSASRRQVSEAEVEATFIPIADAEPIPETNSLILNFRRLLRRNRNAARDDIEIIEAEIPAEDQIGPLAQVNGEGTRPINVHAQANRYRWF